MATMYSDPVSVDRLQADPVGRRADAHSQDDAGLSDNASIVLSKFDYDNLVAIARCYANLTQNLVNGGVDSETLALLSGDDSTWSDNQTTTSVPSTSPVRICDGRPKAAAAHSQPCLIADGQAQNNANQISGKTTQAPGIVQPGLPKHAHQSYGNGWAEEEALHDDEAFEMENIGEASTKICDGDATQACGPPSRPQYERVATRTIQLCSLPEGTSHAEIAAVVRGGLLLDIFLRSHERSAQVSFLNAADALGFYDHARRHDLYIKFKRVDVRWADRQFILPGHIANKIGVGATRNLVIRRVDSRHTEEAIREDLDHIHNLVVIRVTFVDGSCHISTNSVNNAMFARTCMMSRLKYKGSKIEWDVDECAQPLEELRPRARPQSHVPTKTKTALNPMANRFQVLNLEDSGDDSESDDAYSS